MVCPKCGTALRAGVDVCHECGAVAPAAASRQPQDSSAELGRYSPGRVLAALWLGVSQVIAGAFLAFWYLLWSLLADLSFSAFEQTPWFFLSWIELPDSLPLSPLVVAGGTVLGIAVGSWKLWARRRHGWAVLVSSLPLLPIALVFLVP